MAILASDVITYARVVTDQETGNQFPDASVLPVLNAVYQRIRRQLAQRVPTLYTKRVQFTATAATQDVTAAPLSLTDFGSVRRIRRLVNSNSNEYEPVGVANDANPDSVPFDQNYVFLEKGTVLEFYPSAQVIGQIFELSYLSQPVALTAVNNSLDVPEGFQEILGEYLASKFRFRFEESAKQHIDAGDAALTEMLWDLTNRYGIQGAGLVEVGVR